MSSISLLNKNMSQSLLAGNDGFATSYQHIQSITVGSLGASSVSFTEIPQNFRHLQIRATARSNRSDYSNDYACIRVNTDTNSNYSYHNLNGDGATAASQNGISQTYMYIQRVASSTSGANIFGALVIDVLDYSNTVKNKTFRTLGGIDANGSGTVALNSGLWINTGSVTSLIFFPNAGASSWSQYSTFSLYGVK